MTTDWVMKLIDCFLTSSGTWASECIGRNAYVLEGLPYILQWSDFSGLVEI